MTSFASGSPTFPASWAISAGDLMMIVVLRRLAGTGLLEEYSNVAAYVARGEARPAFQRAFAAQHALFVASREAG